MRRGGITGAKTVTIYNEKYYARANAVMPHQALAIAQDADCIYAVEQGEIEIPSLDKQRRMVCVLRFERIIRAEPKSELCENCDASPCECRSGNEGDLGPEAK